MPSVLILVVVFTIIIIGITAVFYQSVQQQIFTIVTVLLPFWFPFLFMHIIGLTDIHMTNSPISSFIIFGIPGIGVLPIIFSSLPIFIKLIFTSFYYCISGVIQFLIFWSIGCSYKWAATVVGCH